MMQFGFQEGVGYIEASFIILETTNYMLLRGSKIWRAKWLKNTSERVPDTCLEFDILAWSLIHFFEFELIPIEFLILFLRSSYL